MFWGLILEAGKRYSQEVVKSFHVSMASLEINPNNDGENGTVPVMLEYGDGREFLLCNLHSEREMQCSLDLSFKAGEHIGFYLGSGKSRVHLTGYLEEEFLDSSDECEEEEEEEEEEETSLLSKPTKRSLSSAVSVGKKQKLALPEEEEEEEDEEDDEDDSDLEMEEEENSEEEEEDSDNIATSAIKKGNDFIEKRQDSDDKKAEKLKQKEGKQLKQQKGNESLQKKANESQQIKGANNTSTPIEKQKKKENLNQTPKTPVHKQNGQVKTPQKKKGKELQGGVIIEDEVEGKGAVAKVGSKVTVYYIGRLKTNNKLFDSTTKGAGFKFVLGRGEVIKGWDIGLPGMKVGGKRIIKIPSTLAYGPRGQPPVIPPNSDLTFEVELRGVN